MRYVLLFTLLLGCGSSEAPPSPPANVQEAEEPGPEVAAPWGVAYRRVAWSLCDGPLSQGDELLFDRTRFDLETGRLLGFLSEDLPPPLALLEGQAMLGVLPHGVGVYDRRNARRLGEVRSSARATDVASDGRRLFVLETRYEGRDAYVALVQRSLPSLEETRRVPLQERAYGNGGAVAIEGDDLVVVVPASCRNGECDTPRLERWTEADPARRRVVTESFEEARLDASGRYALLLGKPAEGDVRVVDTRDGRTIWRVRGLAPSTRFGWPQDAALAPGGEIVALVETSAASLRLRIVERDGEGSSDAFISPTEPAHVSFVGSRQRPTLLVTGQGFAAIRRGGAAPEPNEESYAPVLPEGFEPAGSPPVLGSVRTIWNAPGRDISVIVTHLDPAELPDDDLAKGFRRVAGVWEGSLAEPERAFRMWSDEGGHHAEMVVPACREGVSNADAYHRLTKTDDSLVHVGLIVPPGTPPARVEALLRPFVDAPLGAPPTPRTLPTLPRRECSI